MKTLRDKLSYAVSSAIFLGGCIILYAWTSRNNPYALREHLKLMAPLALELCCLLIIVAGGVTLIGLIRSGHIHSLWSDVTRTAWLWLGAIILMGTMIVVFVVPREHRIFYDEDIYQNIAQNIAYTKGAGSFEGEPWGQAFANFWKRFIGSAGMCNEGRQEYGEYQCIRLEYNKQPNAWPHLLSVVFRLSGVSELSGFLTNNAVYALTILTVFLLGYLLFEDMAAGLFAALIFALTPEAMIWSNTVAVEPSAALFAGLTVLCLLLFLKTRLRAALFLSAAVAAYAIQFRPESAMILIVAGLLLLCRGRNELQQSRFYLAAAIFFIILIPHIVHLYAVKDLGWGGSGPKFSFDHFMSNVSVNTLFYVRNTRFPALVTVFFLLGMVLNGGGGLAQMLKAKAALLVWFLLFWGIFIFFYAGSYNYGADVRFSLLSYITLALLAGQGASGLTNLLRRRFSHASSAYMVAAVLIMSFLSFLPMLRAITQEAWAARADHRFAREMADALPLESVVLTHNPNMFLLWGKNAAQASLATEQKSYFSRFFGRYKGGIFFHYNFWCNVNDPLQNSFCTNILNWYECTPMKSYQERDYRFVLYRVARKPGEAGQTSAQGVPE